MTVWFFFRGVGNGGKSVKWAATHIKHKDRLLRYERFPLNPVHLEVSGC